ncbi:hypothetical protein cyc_06184 [Cyclospora cayetanensis]|uniref:Uncharacterized protein n=1 Tax=Cyclospora cayetanensis TaxID=88456 RepID=A0A1D3D4K2_9EIME|nr:hypothetical protein cyc_06184 [Cyclospora cayetanensis]
MGDRSLSDSRSWQCTALGDGPLVSNSRMGSESSTNATAPCTTPPSSPEDSLVPVVFHPSAAETTAEAFPRTPCAAPCGLSEDKREGAPMAPASSQQSEAQALGYSRCASSCGASDAKALGAISKLRRSSGGGVGSGGSGMGFMDARRIDGKALAWGWVPQAGDGGDRASPHVLRASVEFFQFLRRTASDGCLLTRGKGPRWAGQKQLSRVGVQELLDRALEVGAAAAVAAPPEEAALVARSVETLVGALQVRVAQGQQRAKLHVLIARSCHHHHSKSTPIISHIHQQMGPLQQQAERPLMLSSEFPEGGQT